MRKRYQIHILDEKVPLIQGFDKIESDSNQIFLFPGFWCAEHEIKADIHPFREVLLNELNHKLSGLDFANNTAQNHPPLNLQLLSIQEPISWSPVAFPPALTGR